MPSSLSNIAAKDGASATVAGGILAIDKSGGGTGPFIQTSVLVDTQGVNTATVKAASTAAVAADTAIVVALSPNNSPVGSGVQATAPRYTLATDSPGLITLGQTTKSASVPFTFATDQAATSPYPTGATAITISATGTTTGITATLAGAAAKTTYIAGFSICSAATAGT